MSETKRSKIKLDEQAVSAVIRFMTTLKRVELLKRESDIHTEIDRVVSAWGFAKKYGVRTSDKKH